MSKKSKEKWIKIPSTNGRYDISNQGRIRSYLKRCQGKFIKHSTPQRFIKIQKDINGYSICGLWYNGKHNTVKVHQLVAKMFIRLPRFGEVVCHKNNIKNDNHVENLEWGSMYYNQVIGKCPSLFKNGEENPAAKLTKTIVINIRSMGKSGKFTHQQIADFYGIQRRNVSKIIRKERWAHLP